MSLHLAENAPEFQPNRALKILDGDDTLRSLITSKWICTIEEPEVSDAFWVDLTIVDGLSLV